MRRHGHRLCGQGRGRLEMAVEPWMNEPVSLKDTVCCSLSISYLSAHGTYGPERTRRLFWEDRQ